MNTTEDDDERDGEFLLDRLEALAAFQAKYPHLYPSEGSPS